MEKLVEIAGKWISQILEVWRSSPSLHGEDLTRERIAFAIAVDAVSELFMRGSARSNLREIETVATTFADAMTRDAESRGIDVDYVDPPFLPLGRVADWARFRDLLGDVAALINEIEEELLYAPEENDASNRDVEINRRLVIVESLRSTVIDMLGCAHTKLGEH